MAWTPLPETITTTVRTPRPKEFTLDPAKTAVVIVDMQNIYRWDRFGDVAEGNERLLHKARAAGAKVLYVQSVRHALAPEITLFRNPLHLQLGTWDVEMMEELAPLPDEPVLQKFSNDIWCWHGIESVLAREGIVAGEWTILATGVSAAGCAEAAAMGFINRSYRTIIPLDCAGADVEGEARVFSLYMEPEYSSIVDFTLSTMIEFATAPVAVRERVLAGSA